MAALSCVYLFQTFGNDNPWARVMLLAKSNFFVIGVFSLLSVHFLVKGVYRARNERVWSIPSVLFFIALSVLVMGIVCSVLTRDVEKQRVIVSDTVNKGVAVTDIRMDLPETILVMGEQSEFRIAGAVAVVVDHRENKLLKFYPFLKTSAGYAYINDAGISPSLDLTMGAKRTTVSNLGLLPPKGTASVPLIPDYKMEISLYPEKEFKKGRVTARQYNLRTPKYSVVIKQDNAIVFDQRIGDNQTIKHGTIKIKSGKTEKWVELAFVRDRTVIMIYAGLIGLLAGMIFYPVEWYFKK